MLEGEAHELRKAQTQTWEALGNREEKTSMLFVAE